MWGVGAPQNLNCSVAWVIVGTLCWEDGGGVVPGGPSFTLEHTGQGWPPPLAPAYLSGKTELAVPTPPRSSFLVGLKAAQGQALYALW